VVRFEQRIKVGLTTLLSALGEGVYDLITLEPEYPSGSPFLSGHPKQPLPEQPSRHPQDHRLRPETEQDAVQHPGPL
jgi:hypothetical protein